MTVNGCLQAFISQRVTSELQFDLPAKVDDAETRRAARNVLEGVGVAHFAKWAIGLATKDELDMLPRRRTKRSFHANNRVFNRSHYDSIVRQLG